MTDWGTTAGTLQGALANIVNECELPSSQQMPLTALASIAAYARDVLARMAPRPVTSSVHDWDAEAAEREQYADVMAADEADQRRMDRQFLQDRGLIKGSHSVIVPTGTGWPVTR